MEFVRLLTPADAVVSGGGGGIPVRRAVIDVGTNSVKLLVADVVGQRVEPVHEESRQTRLGKGFYDTHRLRPDSIAKTADAVAEFVRTAQMRKAEAIRVIATSAARDATNPQDLLEAIERTAGLKTEIISGTREAEWAFQGAATDSGLGGGPLLLLDVGGGSTEFILGGEGRTHFAHSFPLGTVRLMEKFPHGDPPSPEEYAAIQKWVGDFLRDEVRPLLAPAMEREAGRVRLVGTGGTATILARMELKLEGFDRERIESTHLTLPQVRAHRQVLWGLPLASRATIRGLPKTRADVILPGILIYETVMNEFSFDQFCVSTRGLRFAAVMG